MNLMRGDDGSMIVVPEFDTVPNFRTRHMSTTIYMWNGRVITYTPEPLRLTYEPTTTPVPPSNAMRRG